MTGSLAFVAAARAAYLVAADLRDKARRLMLPAKNNLGPDATGLAFCIEAALVPSQAGWLATSRVVWEPEPVTITADEAMQTGTGTGDTTATREAADWLTETLATGPMAASEIRHQAEQAGIAWITLRRAADSVGVQKSKTALRGGWEWSLPPKMLKPSEDAQQNLMSTFGNDEHLREREADPEIEL